jgi:hypothetical protein
MQLASAKTGCSVKTEMQRDKEAAQKAAFFLVSPDMADDFRLKVERTFDRSKRDELQSKRDPILFGVIKVDKMEVESL